MVIMLTKRRPNVENFLVDITVKSQGNTDFRDSAM